MIPIVKSTFLQVKSDYRTCLRTDCRNMNTRDVPFWKHQLVFRLSCINVMYHQIMAYPT